MHLNEAYSFVCDTMRCDTSEVKNRRNDTSDDKGTEGDVGSFTTAWSDGLENVRRIKLDISFFHNDKETLFRMWFKIQISCCSL